MLQKPGISSGSYHGPLGSKGFFLFENIRVKIALKYLKVKATDSYLERKQVLTFLQYNFITGNVWQVEKYKYVKL